MSLGRRRERERDSDGVRARSTKLLDMQGTVFNAYVGRSEGCMGSCHGVPCKHYSSSKYKAKVKVDLPNSFGKVLGIDIAQIFLSISSNTMRWLYPKRSLKIQTCCDRNHKIWVKMSK